MTDDASSRAHPAARPGIAAPKKVRRTGRRRRHRAHAPFLHAHPLAGHRLKGRVRPPAAAVADLSKES